MTPAVWKSIRRRGAGSTSLVRIRSTAPDRASRSSSANLGRRRVVPDRPSSESVKRKQKDYSTFSQRQKNAVLF